MHLKRARFQQFKRFTDLTIDEIPQDARLVVLTGPNGTGKSAVFEGFNWYRRYSGGFGNSNDASYFPKTDAEGRSQAQPKVDIVFHEAAPQTQDDKRKCMLIRSAYRHEADFQSDSLRKHSSLLDDPGIERLILVEQTVRRNYERLSSRSLVALFDPANDSKSVKALREEQIGQIQATMRRVFDALVLRSVGNPLEDGAFFFDKGNSRRFHYKNLSAGEKSAFDLILDFHLKLEAYNDTVFCIDEPELHLGSRVQGTLLECLFEAIPPKCQLWIATHALGMMRKALELHRRCPSDVVFIDTSNADFDAPTTLKPVVPDRRFWRDILEVALDDLAHLVAPSQVILCEGAEPRDGFDAEIYRMIFAREFPDTEFISVGNSHEVKVDRREIGSAIGVLAPGTAIRSVVDRDEHALNEIDALQKRGVRVLGRRNIECYLLDNEILRKLCQTCGLGEKSEALLASRDEAVAKAAERGQAADDFKNGVGAVQVFAQKTMNLRESGSSGREFIRSTIAPLVTPDTQVYSELRIAIFGKKPGPK